MKIAVNTRFLLRNKLEGIGWFSFEILSRMVKSHPEITFYFLFDRKWDPAFVFGPNVVPVQVFPQARHPVLHYVWFEYAVPSVLRKLKPDAFISTDGFLSLNTEVKTLLWWHDITYKYFPEANTSVSGRYYAYFVPKFLARADRIITFSKHAASELVEKMQVPASKIAVSAGAARAAFQPLADATKGRIMEQYAGGQPYFLYVGALQPRKNVQLIIHAFDQFKTRQPSGMKLLLAGRLAWKYEGVLKSYREARHQSDIHFLGHIDAALPLIMGAAYALVYPSLYEGFGLPIIESIQCRVPVITSDCSSMPQVCGQAGLLVNPLQADSITDAMCEITQNKVLYEKLKSNCLAQSTVFSWDQTAEEVYQTLIALTDPQGSGTNEMPLSNNIWEAS